MDQQILQLKQNENWINNTNINHIASFLNITNSSSNKEKNKEGLIDEFLDECKKKSNTINRKLFQKYFKGRTGNSSVNII